MNCPFCVSEIDDSALVCKVCRRDVYLHASLINKIHSLEEQISQHPDTSALRQRIDELEQLLRARQNQPKAERPLARGGAVDLLVYLIVPLLLLLVAHELIVMVWDLKIIYLRFASILIPAPFAFHLFQRGVAHRFLWSMYFLLMSLCAVTGMSWLTSLEDGTPVFPDHQAAWIEYIDFAASIFFSCMTGLILGISAKNKRDARDSELQQKVISLHSTKVPKISIVQVGSTLKLVQEYGSTVVAIGSTAMSIYTGLKGII